MEMPPQDSDGTRPPMRSDINTPFGRHGHQGIEQNMGEVRWQGQGPPMQHKGEAQENQNVQPLTLPPMAGETNTPAAGLTNAGAVPQGPAEQQGAAGISPVGQAGMAIAPPIIGHQVTPPTSTQVLHRLSLA
jgi:hypothetical protein